MPGDSIALTPRSFSEADLNRLKDFLVERVTPQIPAPQEGTDQRVLVQQKVSAMYAQLNLHLPDDLHNRIIQMVCDEIAGYGPIQPLLNDPAISEVMVNGPHKVYIETEGKLTKTDITFENDEEVMRVIEKIIQPLGRNVSRKSPTVDARLPDGSRVNAVIPPVAIDGPSITIRKFRKDKLKVEDMVNYGSITENMATFLQACVISKLNIVISGGTGSGKTTLLNVLSGFIPADERIVTVEDAAELQLQQEHVVRMEAQTPDLKGEGEVTIRDLVRNALRMRPDRIVVGECRGGEALDMLQAMNTGHDGSLTTVHANSPRDAVSRLEILVMMAGMELPVMVVRQQIASAVDLIVQVSRLRDGTRKILSVTEVSGMEGDTIVLTDIFKFEQTGVGEDGKVEGTMKPTGLRPLFMPRLEAAGIKLKPEVLGATLAEVFERTRRH